VIIATLSLQNASGLVLAVLLLGYLVYALVRAEKL
jgi:K+-transporting ATPase KdpF subunit